MVTAFVVPGRKYIIPLRVWNNDVTNQYSELYNGETFLSIDATLSAEDIYIHPVKIFYTELKQEETLQGSAMVTEPLR